ncbi:MAG TPA: hypothetical protein VG842_01145, partial [Sediminibacterium sp.]|nr:hypothetical protein [Sediminibacterium sp.]
MQLKGLVRFFAIALILICLYQLSFTLFVKMHESSMEEKAAAWMKRFPTPEEKYPGNKELQSAYADSLSDIKRDRLKRLLDSTKETKLAFGLTTYGSAKEKELMLGLDLQGGMSVTMEVGLDGLIKSLANYTKDPDFNKALDQAVAIKANTSADLINLFQEQLKKVNPALKLAPFFAARSNGTVKYDASDDAVISYLKKQAGIAFNTTYRILRTRIDRFGVASPNINPDPAKGYINIELAGVTDKERVRHFLQSTANLQFFEVYTFESKELQNGLVAADKAVEDYLDGIKPADSSAAPKLKDTTAKKATVYKADSGKTTTLSSLAKAETPAAKKDSATLNANKNPLGRLIQFTQPYQGTDGKVVYPAAIGYVATKDTGTLDDYLRMDIVKNKFPANLVFMYGKSELS